MGVLTRLAALAGYEKRTPPDPSWAALGANIGRATTVSARAAENLSTVLACVNAISTALASVTPRVYRVDAKGERTEAPAHPLSKLARAGVNERQTWPEFVEHLMASTLLTGNGLAIINRGGNGQLSGLTFVPWSFVSVSILSTGRLAYDVNDPWGVRGRFLEGEVIHLRDRTDDGRLGRSRLSRAAETVAGAEAANTHARSFLQKGASPSGIVEIDKPMNDAQFTRFATEFRQAFNGADQAGKTMILDGGAKWRAAQISPEDAELLETRKFGVIELCRLFQVPPPIVQSYENNTFTNASQAGLWFATFCLTPWARKVEAEFARSVFPMGGAFELELDLSGFLRGDPETRWNAHKIAIETGVLDPDEVRQIEGWNPRKPGAEKPDPKPTS